MTIKSRDDHSISVWHQTLGLRYSKDIWTNESARFRLTDQSQAMKLFNQWSLSSGNWIMVIILLTLPISSFHVSQHQHQQLTTNNFKRRLRNEDFRKVFKRFNYPFLATFWPNNNNIWQPNLQVLVKHLCLVWFTYGFPTYQVSQKMLLSEVISFSLRCVFFGTPCIQSHCPHLLWTVQSWL